MKVIILLLLLHNCESARILIAMPVSSYSHQVFSRPIVIELLKRGHEVVYITTDPINDSTLVNLTEIDINNTYKTQNVNVASPEELENYKGLQLNFLNELQRHVPNYLEQIFDHPDIQALVTNKDINHFDIVLVEWIQKIFGMFSHVYDCPLVGLLPIGNVFDASIDLGIPFPFLQTFDTNFAASHPMTFKDRLIQLYYYAGFTQFQKRCQNVFLKVAKKYFGTQENEFYEMKSKMRTILVNQHPAFTGASLDSPAIVNVGGLMYKPAKSLSQDLQLFLDDASEGVIYFSLGTNIISSSLHQDKILVLLDVFKNLPYKVIWKWDNESLSEALDNVLIKKWFPQNDLLNHRNVKCFITHGGMQSIEEAIHAQVPLIGIPFVGDQHFNVHRIQKLKIGLEQQYWTLNQKDLTDAITMVVETSIYKDNMIKLSKLYLDQIVPPLDKAIWWIEHIIRHKEYNYLRNPLLEYSFVEFYMLDILGLLLSLFIVIIFLVCLFVRLIIKCVNKKKIKIQ